MTKSRVVTSRGLLIMYAAIIAVWTAVSAAANWELINPETGDKTRLKVKDKTWTYWRLSENSATILKITGPTRLKVYTRAALPNGKKDGLFGIVIARDDGEGELIGRATQRTKTAVNPKDKNEAIGAPRTLYFKVPAGVHEYAIKLPKGAAAPVYARFFIENSQSKSVEYIAFLPRNYPEEVKVAIKEQEYIYYRTTSSNDVEIEVIGPAKVKGIARLEFDHTMRGEKTFRVQVKENGKVIMTKPLTGQISEMASYIGIVDKLISKGETFYIDVPEGKHRYKVNTPDAGMAVIFRFYIPDRALGNIYNSNQQTDKRILGLN